ncbi:DUF4258 domain-containing protein [Candidatus Woesebacteria bacterium]|nr:DUF4258 domain-containing protein [Candidatus Woesebacteria bacterium]
MKKDYGGVVWTDHALERMRDRGIKQGDAWATFRSPHSSKNASTKDAYIYYKTFGSEKIEVVAKKDEDKWIIISVWSKKLEKQKNKSIFSFIKKLFK